MPTRCAPSVFMRIAFIFFVIVGTLAPQYASAQTPSLLPGKLAIYYGFPSAVNGAATLDAAAAVLSAYAVVIFGDTLQLPQHNPSDLTSNPVYDKACTQNSHLDHDNTIAIIQRLKTSPYNTAVYGYISVGGENTARVCPSTRPNPTPLTDQEIQNFVDAWEAMGVAGIFFDEAGYDFGTSRARQNAAVDYVHSKGLRVFINAFHPDDIFSPSVVGTVTYPSDSNLAGQTSIVPMNPAGLPTHLGPNDISLLESFQIILGSFRDPRAWEDRSDKALYYKHQFGTHMATVTTAQDVSPYCGFDQSQFDYAWWSTLVYGFDYMAWGEGANFSAAGPCNGRLPLRTRPAPRAVGSAFTSPTVVHDVSRHTRSTTAGTIEVNTDAHTGQFVGLSPLPDVPPPGIIPPSGLGSWWPGDGSAQDIAGNNHGALQVGKSWFAPGKVGQAFSFDGLNDFIAFGTGPALTGTGPFTVDAWIKTTDAQGVILQQRDASARGFDGEYILSVGGFAPFAVDKGKVCWATFGSGLVGINICSRQVVDNGVFHHIAVTREADGSGRIYIDGVIDSWQSSVPVTTLRPLSVFIGADKRDNAAFFKGLIDEVEIYNRALTASEIQAIVGAGSAGKIKPSSHTLWVFSDEVTSSTARAQLVQRSADSGVNALYLSVLRSTANSAGRLMYEDSAITDLITQAHTAGIEVWAAYGARDWPRLGCATTVFPLQRMTEVVAYNTANPAARFDGVALDVKPAEPQAEADFQALLGLYNCILDTVKPASLGLAVAIRFFWNDVVTFPATGLVTQLVYEHIIDMDLHKVVVMGYRDVAGTACPDDGIICLDEDEVAYADTQGRANLILAGLETANCVPHCGAEKMTFFEEGQSILNHETGIVAQHFGTYASFGGFAVHRYGDSYLKGMGNWPESNPGFLGVHPAYWRFEEGLGTTALDSSGNGNSGTISRATYATDTPVLPGVTNYSALSFDAKGDFVTIPAGPGTTVHSFTRGLTLEAFIKPTQLPIPPDAAGQRSKYILWADDDIFALRLVSDAIGNTSLVGVGNAVHGAVGPCTGFVTAPFSNALAGTFSHVALTYGSGVFKLYINGAQVAEAWAPAGCSDAVGPVEFRHIVRIGSDETAVGFPNHDRDFRGVIDEVRITGGPLTPPAFLVFLIDQDGDGIFDAVDPLPTTLSGHFSDGTTSGTIVDQGEQALRITDAPGPQDGVWITADRSGGVTPAIISACTGAATFSFSAGNAAIVTCGSVIIKVIGGTVDTTFVAADGGDATVSLEDGNSLTFEPMTGTITASPINPDAVEVLIGGGRLFLRPGDSQTLAPQPLTVAIDIKPGGLPNSINPKSRGKLSVAILSTAGFEAPARVDCSSLTFGRTGDEQSLGFCNASPEDVNRDGFLDLVCHFDTLTAAFKSGDTQGMLKGRTVTGIPIMGTDAVRIVR